MWQILDSSQDTAFALASSARELLEETMRSLIFAVGGLWLLFQVVLTAYWTGLFDRQTWPLTILYSALAAFTLFFLPKQLRLAQLGWLIGLGAIPRNRP
jgi:hypothetical protein